MIKLRLLGTLVFLFFCGGFAGALGFKNIGFIATAPLAATLMFWQLCRLSMMCARCCAIQALTAGWTLVYCVLLQL